MQIYCFETQTRRWNSSWQLTWHLLSVSSSSVPHQILLRWCSLLVLLGLTVDLKGSLHLLFVKGPSGQLWTRYSQFDAQMQQADELPQMLLVSLHCHHPWRSWWGQLELGRGHHHDHFRSSEVSRQDTLSMYHTKKERIRTSSYILNDAHVHQWPNHPTIRSDLKTTVDQLEWT